MHEHALEKWILLYSLYMAILITQELSLETTPITLS
jgi:hypothetical protein